jgi:hypothetical protein
MTKARFWIAASILAALVAALWLSGTSTAGDSKALQDTIDKIAGALQKGDQEGAKKQAETLAKKLDDIAEAMDLFKPRKKNGFGVGKTPGAINPDGIEQMLLKIGRDAPAAGTLKKDGAALEEMGYRIAALGLIAAAKGAPKTAKGTPKDWNGWSNDTVKGGLDVAAAAKAKGGADVKSAASKLNNACNSCHTVFR